MPRPAQLHVTLAAEEMAAPKALAYSLGTTVSDTARTLVQAGTRVGTDSMTVLVLDRRTLARYVRNVRTLGHILNQSMHALNAIAKAVHESGVNALHLTKALKGVSYELAEVRRDAAEVKRQAAELTGMPVVFEG